MAITHSLTCTYKCLSVTIAHVYRLVSVTMNDFFYVLSLFLSRHHIIRVANFMLLLTTLYVYISWSARFSLSVFYFAPVNARGCFVFFSFILCHFTQSTKWILSHCYFIVVLAVKLLSFLFLFLFCFISNFMSISESRWHVCDHTSYEAIRIA